MNSEQSSMNILSQYMNSVANNRDMYDNENNNNNNNNNNGHEHDREQDHDHNYDYSGDGGMSEHDFGSSHYHHYLSPSSSSSHRLNSSNSNDRKEKDKHRNDIYRRKIEQRKLYYFLLSNGSTVQSANPEKKKKEQVKERLKKRLERQKTREETLQRPPTASAKDYESNSTEKKENLSKHEMSAISNNSDIHSKKKKKKVKTGKKKETKKTKSEYKELNPAEKSDEKQTMGSPKKLYDNDNCEELDKLDVHESLANSDNKDEEEMNLVNSDHSSTCDDLDERAATGDVAMEVESFDNNLYYQSSPDPTSEESTTIRQTLKMNISNRSFKSMKTEEYLTDPESKGLDESKATYDEYDDKDEDNNNDTLMTDLEKQTMVNTQSKEENITNGGGFIKKREKTKEKENINVASSVPTKHKRKKKTKTQNKNQSQNEEHLKENEKIITFKDDKITLKEQTVQTPIQTLPLFLGTEKKFGEVNSNSGFGKINESKKTPISSPSTWETSSIAHNFTTNAYTTVSQEISDVERKRPTKPPISNRVNCTVQIQPITINSFANDTDVVTPKRPSKPPLKPSFQSPVVVNNNRASRPPIPVLNFSRMKNGSQSSNMITPVSSVATTTTPNPISTPTPTPTPVSTFTSTIPSLIPIGGTSAMSQLPSYPNDSQFLLESLGSLLATTSTATAAVTTTPTTIPASNRMNPNSYGVNAFPLIPSAMNTFSVHSVSIPNSSIYNNSDTYTISDLSTIEQADEWVDFELSSRSYPSSLWTLNMKSLKVHPELSLDKLKVLMRSK